MKHLSTIAICAFLSIGAVAQTKAVKYENEDFSCSYSKKNGRLDGTYTSFYSNGTKRASGQFRNNCRTGKWTVWDPAGRVSIERNYEDPFNFERITPVPSAEQAAVTAAIPDYKLHNNAEGFVDYFPIEEKMVVFSKRLWRYVTPEQNPELFRNNALLQALNKNIATGAITAYSPADDQFTEKLASLPADLSSMEVIGYKVKEDFFFDTERLVSETRVIGVCPVVVNTQTKDTLDLYWVFYPKIRKYLAMETIPTARSYDYVHTLDDVFFHRAFSGFIYKQSSLSDRESEIAYAKEDDAKTVRIESELIETEHDFWITFTK